MAKIIKVAPATHTPSVAKPIRTSRNSATNPFMYTNFEGNTLQFADVFEGFEPKKVNKMKLIASSVAGSMHRIRTNIVESVSQFVGRIADGITSAWDYAKNTNISDLGAVKTFNRIMNTPVNIPGIDAVGNSLGSIKSAIAGKISSMSGNIIGLGDDINQKWAMVVSRFNTRRVSSDLSVADLEQMWRAEMAVCESGGIS